MQDPKNVPKIIVKTLCFKLNPNSHPKNPVTKQLKFMVPLAHTKAIIHALGGFLSSGSTLSGPEPSMPSLRSSSAS